MQIKQLFLLFMLYSFFGWIIEMLVVAMEKGKFTPRGFLIGPYLPIFGVGAISITLLLSNYKNDIFVLFIMSAFLGAILEYVVSYVFEKLFKTRWWNYEHDKFNLNGRVCLSATIGFGILGLMVIEFFNPIFLTLINNMNPITQNILAIILLIIFITDIIISFTIISKIKIYNNEKSKDTTEEITKKVIETLKNRSILSKRLIKAFPNLKIKKNKV